MTIPTRTSFSGFIASEPKLTATRKGITRFYARVGHEHGEWDENGDWKELEPSFHNLVQYGKPALRSYEQFQVGDRFVAEGQVKTYEGERDGETVEFEEFVAKRLGHDSGRTNYIVDRSSRRTTATQEQGRATPERRTTVVSNGNENSTYSGQARGLATNFADRPSQQPARAPVVQPRDMYL